MGKADNRIDRFGQAVSELFGVVKASESYAESDALRESAEPNAEYIFSEQRLSIEEASIERMFQDDNVPPRRENCTYFAAGTSVEGILRSDSDVEIVGDFSGEIMAEGKVTIHANTVSSIAAKSLELIGSTLAGGVTTNGDVTLDAGSSITGNIRALSIDSAGVIKGNLSVQDSVVLRGQASVTGDIKTALLSIERGVKVNGKVDMAQ